VTVGVVGVDIVVVLRIEEGRRLSGTIEMATKILQP
jgi:hypothetical protein